MTFIEAIGGLGIFLLGMIIMTEGLSHLGGNLMRHALTRFTRTPLSAVVTGATSTALLQSSSATTVATVGFVAVGILTFSQALGIIFGANLGTTITGWLVALIGFKLKLQIFVLPIIFLGAFLRLFTKGRLANLGYAIAGFGTIFVGITMMQEGMAGLQGILTPDIFPQNTFFGRLQLVILGAMVTVVTQSSSAGVAATLTALNIGNINLAQAMCLVIGMDIGTTVTVMLAAIGRDVAVQRTGLSHVLYNLVSGCIGFALVSPFIQIWQFAAPTQITNNAEIILVAFHSFFNLIAIILMLPLIKNFASIIQKLIPERKTGYTKRLNENLLAETPVAIVAIKKTVETELLDLLVYLNSLLGAFAQTKQINLEKLQLAINETYQFVDCIHLESREHQDWNNLLAIIHCLDHLQRLYEHCDRDQERVDTIRQTPELIVLAEKIVKTNDLILLEMNLTEYNKSLESAEKAAIEISQYVKPYRRMIMARIAYGKQDVSSATNCFEAIRWLERVSRHLYQIIRYLAKVRI